MRQLVTSLVTSGGLLAAVAFFLPWVAVSCDGQPLGTVSAYDRATGLADETPNQPDSALTDGAGLEPRHALWWLLVVPLALVTAGLATAIPSWNLRQSCMSAAAVAVVGLVTTVKLGVADKLQIQWPAVEALGVRLSVTLQVGVWLSLLGYTLALAGAVVGTLMATRIQRDPFL